MMPWSAIVRGACLALREMELEARDLMRADDDGMAQPYIKLDAGINAPRAWSWAEERALQHDLLLSIDPVACYPGRRVYRFPFAKHVHSIWGSAGQ